MSKVEFEICSNNAYSSLLNCINILLERQNIIKPKNQSYEIIVLVALSLLVTSMNSLQLLWIYLLTCRDVTNSIGELKDHQE